MSKLSHPASEHLTQGTIFSCAVAEDYPGVTVWGIIVTARCDAFNDKAQIYTYVPIVAFDDWLLVDAIQVLSHRCRRAALGEAKNVLRAANESDDVVDLVALDEVLASVFPDSTKGVGKQFKGATDRYMRATLAATGSIPERQAWLGSERAEAKRLLRELLANGLAEFHYLEDVEPHGDGAGYVALLREVRHLPRALALAIMDGLDGAAYARICSDHPRFVGRLQVEDDAISWPVGVLASPDIELVLQRLTLLFARVGVDDPAKGTLKELEKRLPSGERS